MEGWYRWYHQTINNEKWIDRYVQSFWWVALLNGLALQPLWERDQTAMSAAKRLAGVAHLNFYVCEGYVFTPVYQSLFTRRGCLPQCMLGYTPPLGGDTPREQTPPPVRSRHPLGSRHLPLGSRHPPGKQTTPGNRHPLEADTPPVQCMLGDTGNKRAVRILLECILVCT